MADVGVSNGNNGDVSVEVGVGVGVMTEVKVSEICLNRSFVFLVVYTKYIEKRRGVVEIYNCGEIRLNGNVARIRLGYMNMWHICYPTEIFYIFCGMVWGKDPC